MQQSMISFYMWKHIVHPMYFGMLQILNGEYKNLQYHFEVSMVDISSGAFNLRAYKKGQVFYRLRML